MQNTEIIDGILCLKRKVPQKEIPFYKLLLKRKCPFFQIVVKIEGEYIYEEAMLYEKVLSLRDNIEGIYSIYSHLNKYKLSCKIENFYMCDGVMKAYILPSEEKFSEESLSESYAKNMGFEKKFFYIDHIYNLSKGESFIKRIPGFRTGNALNTLVAIIIYFDCFLWALAITLVFKFNPVEWYFWLFWYIVTAIVLFCTTDFLFIAERIVSVKIPRWIKIAITTLAFLVLFSVPYLLTGFILMYGGL